MKMIVRFRYFISQVFHAVDPTQEYQSFGKNTVLIINIHQTNTTVKETFIPMGISPIEVISQTVTCELHPCRHCVPLAMVDNSVHFVAVILSKTYLLI